MKVYKLRSKQSGLFYKGKGTFGPEGRVYTSKGHIKNSIKQTYRGRVSDRFELLTYTLTLEKTEDL